MGKLIVTLIALHLSTGVNILTTAKFRRAQPPAAGVSYVGQDYLLHISGGLGREINPFVRASGAAWPLAISSDALITDVLAATNFHHARRSRWLYFYAWGTTAEHIGAAGMDVRNTPAAPRCVETKPFSCLWAEMPVYARP